MLRTPISRDHGQGKETARLNPTVIRDCFLFPVAEAKPLLIQFR